MDIFVAWQDRRASPVPADRVAPRLAAVFAPLFGSAVQARCAALGPATLASVSLPTAHFLPAAHAVHGQQRVYAPQYPLNARAVVERLGAPRDVPVLPALVAALTARPREVLRELVPPYALLWTDPDGGALHVQTDGLGHALLYEYERDGLWAVTNRPLALAALGVDLEPDPDGWAARVVLGWFPLELTGFRHLTYLGPGRRVTVTQHGRRRRGWDVLSDWVGESPRPVEECLELAEASVLDAASAAAGLVDRPELSLSGGRDSRAVFAAALAAGIAVRPKVRGPAGHPDVVVAERLAAVAGTSLELLAGEGLPPDTAEPCREAVLRALLWQAGGRNFHQHKTFQVTGPFTAGGSVGFTGQYGEVGRSQYRKELRKRAVDPGGPDALLEHLTRGAPAYLRPSALARGRELARAALAACEAHPVAEVRRLDFAYLFERVRRWSSVAQAGKAGFSVGPFLHPGYLRAVFSHPDVDLVDSPFHARIVADLQPAWAGVPYATDLAAAPGAHAGGPLAAPEQDATRPRWQRPRRRRFYDTHLYWEDVGRPVLDAALREGGFWTSLVDPDRAGDAWLADPDALAVLGLLEEALAGARRSAQGAGGATAGRGPAGQSTTGR